MQMLSSLVFSWLCAANHWGCAWEAQALMSFWNSKSLDSLWPYGFLWFLDGTRLVLFCQACWRHCCDDRPGAKMLKRSARERERERQRQSESMRFVSRLQIMAFCNQDRLCDLCGLKYKLRFADVNVRETEGGKYKPDIHPESDIHKGYVKLREKQCLVWKHGSTRCELKPKPWDVVRRWVETIGWDVCPTSQGWNTKRSSRNGLLKRKMQRLGDRTWRCWSCKWPCLTIGLNLTRYCYNIIILCKLTWLILSLQCVSDEASELGEGSQP